MCSKCCSNAANMRTDATKENADRALQLKQEDAEIAYQSQISISMCFVFLFCFPSLPPTFFSFFLRHPSGKQETLKRKRANLTKLAELTKIEKEADDELKKLEKEKKALKCGMYNSLPFSPPLLFFTLCDIFCLFFYTLSAKRHKSQHLPTAGSPAPAPTPAGGSLPPVDLVNLMDSVRLHLFAPQPGILFMIIFISTPISSPLPFSYIIPSVNLMDMLSKVTPFTPGNFSIYPSIFLLTFITADMNTQSVLDMLASRLPKVSKVSPPAAAPSM
jgi:hypothetical protein